VSAERPDRRTVGIGSMVADRIHRVPRILGIDQKGILRTGQSGRTAELRVGGVVLNHLGWAAVLGLPVGIFGKQADDANGRFLRDAMDRFGIAKDLVLDGSASSFADIYVDDAGSRAIYMAPGATSETTYAHVRRHHERTIQSALRVSTEVSQLPLAAALEVLRLAELVGIPTLVDLDVPPSDAVPILGTQAELDQLLRRAKVLKPSALAARELVLTAGGDALASAKKLRERYGNEAVIVTDGEEGCAVATAKEALRMPAYAVTRVVDTTGAGDAFLGGVLVGLAAGLGWPDTLRLGNACGAACVEKLGAFPDEPLAARDAVLARYDGAPLPAWVTRGLAAVPEAQPANEALVAFGGARCAAAARRRPRLRPRGRVDRRGARQRRPRARDRHRQARARGALRRGPARIDRDAGGVPVGGGDDARQRRAGGARRRRDRHQQQRRDGRADRRGRRGEDARRRGARHHRRAEVVAGAARRGRARRRRRAGGRRPRLRAPCERGCRGRRDRCLERRARARARLHARRVPHAASGRVVGEEERELTEAALSARAHPTRVSRRRRAARGRAGA
jgi:ribokinase